jgi:peptidoglycan/xylan/chitin deacetylase (PgdA/CDA1 family)
MSASIVKVAKRVARYIIGRPIVGRSILVYHRIAKADFDPFNIAITAEEFERQLATLRSKAVLPLSEFARLNLQRKLPRNAVAITFDDGYACNAVTAAPMLESFGYPATFFIVSDAIERPEEFWWDRLDFIVNAPQFDNAAAIHLLTSRTTKGSGETVHQNAAPLVNFLTLWRLLRDFPAEERRRYFEDLCSTLGIERKMRSTHRPMTLLELRTLASKPLFEIGGHTATHPSLPALARSEQQREIVRGSRYLEAVLGKSIRSFAYPFGDWAPATAEILREAGFVCAVTAEHRTVRPGDNQFELPRRQALSRNARML